MEATPRSWQFSLSNWPVTRKVGIVLVLPVLLASTFAVLRINSELQTINQLSAGTEQAAIMRSTTKFETATQNLAIAAITGWGNTEADPVLDAATGKFDQAVADLETRLRSSKADPQITQEMTQAIGVARTMRNSLRSGSPATLAEQTETVSTRIQATLSTSQSVSELQTQQLFLQLGTIMTGGRLLTQERVMLASPDLAKNPALRARLLTSIGAEITMLEVYAGLNPGQAQNFTQLKDAAGIRIGVLSQNVPDPAAIPAMSDAVNASLEAYSKESEHLAASLDARLGQLSTDARNTVLRDTSVVIGMLLAGLALALVVGRSLVVLVRRLRRDALQVAHIDLPRELEVVRSGGAAPEITPVDVHTTEEIGQLARAVDDIHAQALHLAGEQARLRLQIGNMFETLSRRSQSLVEQQLNLIEELERDEDDSERLQSLFRLDHLATRMRRNGDNLLVLAGTALRRGHLAPVPLSDMLWSSVSQVEDYQRVEIGTVPDGIVAGEPAVDIEHLLAELIDNALRYSPPTTPVAVSVARAVDGGYLIEITDRGLGMNAEDLQSINDRLASGGEVNVETARRMGLFVVGRLAKRHNITVSLRRTSAMVQQPGITASVHLPGSLVSPAPERVGDSTGQYPVAATALPVAPPAGTPAPVSAPQPSITPPRLMPVPNPPEVARFPETTTRFGVTSSGLPQRKTPGMDTGELPALPGFVGEQQKSDSFSDAFADQDTSVYPAQVDFWGDSGRSDEQQPSPTDEPRFTRDEPQFTRDEPQFTRDEPQFTHEEQRFPGIAPGDPATQRFEPMSPIKGGGYGYDDSAADRSYDTGFNAFGGGSFETGSGAGANGNGIGANGIAANANGGNDTAEPAEQHPAGDDHSPIYQRMVSEWLVEPAAGSPSTETWTSASDAGWAAAEEAANPTTSDRTQGGLPIRRPGAQLVPGAVTQEDEGGARNPEEIRSSLTRHLSGVRSGRADSQYNDGGHA
ncbi:sensor histidine kinase [Nocardia crassostreae]|uniref:sensor histidine kinase n=1 Tax=Nocardia crassostreae TaxID=53428 RepID=UPI00082A59F6|nr:sensor histidine kinase [Nocardia crassostreae]